jgi:hypothetical protein
VFYDLGHVSAFGVPVVGEAIATAILAQLRDDGSGAELAVKHLDSGVVEQPGPASSP